MNNDYSKVGLYNHNIESYEKVKTAFEKDDVVGIVHATGTGKSYNALQLAYDNKDKKITYVVPSNGIIEYLKKIIENNSNLDLEKDFTNLEFRTYQSFINLSRDEIEKIDVDLLILDEFHHIGAPIWGSRIDIIIETHPNIKIFGMTAYTVRDRGTPYERDMANPDEEELFSNKIVSRYDLCDALIDGVLPKPIYKSARIKLFLTERVLEEKVLKLNPNSKDYKELMPILESVKKQVQNALGTEELIRKNIQNGDKVIYFCPPNSEFDVNDIETIKKEAYEWFKKYIPEEDIIFYTSTSEMGDEGKLNRQAFYDDLTLDGKSADGKLRIMFAINQYNEGIHAPNVNKVIMGRGTKSDIVFFEQLGRGLSARENYLKQYEQLEKLSIDELTQLCNKRDISINNDLSKLEIIEKLMSPVIIDLAGNIDFIKELENNLKNRIKEISNQGLGKKRKIKLSDALFDIEVENEDLYKILKYVTDRLTMTWESKYELAKAYYEHYGNLEVPQIFKTINGIDYDENGIALGNWIRHQRENKNLSEQRKEKLIKIGMRFMPLEEIEWMKKYELAKAYYEHYGNLEIPLKFKTKNGIDYDEDGIALGTWISTQRKNEKLSKERTELLNKIGMQFENLLEVKWQKKYELAKAYYEHYGNLEIPLKFKTKNGIDYDKDGIALGAWISTQRNNKKITLKRKKLLEEIGMRFTPLEEIEWMKKYALAKTYYEYYGHLEISKRFKTKNGIDYDEDGIALGVWLLDQRQNEKLSTERKKLLEEIEMRFESKEKLDWEKNYALAKAYYEHHGNLKISNNFKTKNGYEFDKDGVKLGFWIDRQKRSDDLSIERKKLLEEIGMCFKIINWDDEWQKNYELAKAYYEHYGNLEISHRYKTKNGIDYDEDGIALGRWITSQRNNKNLKEERKILLEAIGMPFDKNYNDDEWQKNYKLAKAYYNHHGNLEIPIDYKTKNGYEYDENGSFLGEWIRYQRKNKKLSKERINLLCEIDMIWYKKYFEKQEISSLNKDRIQSQLLVKLKNILSKLPNDINSKEDIENINKEFKDSIGKQK